MTFVSRACSALGRPRELGHARWPSRHARSSIHVLRLHGSTRPSGRHRSGSLFISLISPSNALRAVGEQRHIRAERDQLGTELDLLECRGHVPGEIGDREAVRLGCGVDALALVRYVRLERPRLASPSTPRDRTGRRRCRRDRAPPRSPRCSRPLPTPRSAGRRACPRGPACDTSPSRRSPASSRESEAPRYAGLWVRRTPPTRRRRPPRRY